MVLAPQLQQSLALLQAPTLELKALVEQELQQNPVLEETTVTETELQERDPRNEDNSPESPDLAEAEARIHEDARLGGFHVGAVAAGTAAQDCHVNSHVGR